MSSTIWSRRFDDHPDHPHHDPLILEAEPLHAPTCWPSTLRPWISRTRQPEAHQMWTRKGGPLIGEDVKTRHQIEDHLVVDGIVWIESMVLHVTFIVSCQTSELVKNNSPEVWEGIQPCAKPRQRRQPALFCVVKNSAWWLWWLVFLKCKTTNLCVIGLMGKITGN